MPEVRWNDGRSRRHLFGLLQTEGHEGDRHESSMKATQATFWQDLKTLVNAKTTSTDDGVWLTHWSSVRNRNLPFFSLHHLNNGDQWKIQRCTKGVNQFEFWPSLLRVWHWELGDEVLPLHEFGLLQLDELSWPRVELLKSEPVWKIQLLQHWTVLQLTSDSRTPIFIYFHLLARSACRNSSIWPRRHHFVPTPPIKFGSRRSSQLWSSTITLVNKKPLLK